MGGTTSAWLMAALECGCESSPTPPYIRFCGRHDPARVQALENLCYAILTRAKEVGDKLDSATGTFLPRIANISASDAMDDLVEEFAPQLRKLMAVGPLPSRGSGNHIPTGVP